MDRANSASATRPGERRRTVLVCALLAFAALAICASVYYYDFLTYDDGDYVIANPHVAAGLTKRGLIWAFVNLHGEHTYWHPLTWVSHMLDCQLFGLNPGPHHLVNVLFHSANSVLLFLVLKRITGAFGRSAMVAALFALHPLQVDTVAWIAERKNVLSTLFWLLTMWAYVRYTELQSLCSRVQSLESNVQGLKSEAGERKAVTVLSGVRRSMFGVRASSYRFWYCITLALFACGLMCKPALVTLPFVLLLLDYWPLQRLQLPRFKVRGSDLRVGRGVPSAAGKDTQIRTIRTSLADPGALSPARPTTEPLWQHALTPAAAKPLSVWRVVWDKLPLLALAAAASIITVAAHRELHSFNRLAMPLDSRIANAVVSYVRYLGKAFWPAHLAVFYPLPEVWPEEMVVGSGLVLLALTGLVIWRARVAPYLVTGWLWFLGALVPMIGIIQAGDQAMADRFAYVPLIGLFIMVAWGAADWAGRRAWGAAGLKWASALALGACALLTSRQLSHWQNGVTLFEHALAVTPDNATAHLVLGCELQGQGQNERALAEYTAAAALIPRTTRANYNLALLLQAKGKWQEAAEQYEIVIRDGPESFNSHFYLAEVLQHLGRPREAVSHLREVVRTNPDAVEALNNLAWTLASSNDPEIRNGAEAVRLAKRACQITEYRATVLIGTLAAAYAEAGRFKEAVATAQKACALASKAKDQTLLKRNQELLELYRAGQPYHEPARTP